MIKRHLHLQHHRHSGSTLHHRHTSYRAIVAVLVLAGVFMIWLAYYSNTKSSVIGPNSAYEAPAPDSIPFISSPAVNSVVENETVDIEGTCAKNTQNYVIIRNLNKVTGSTNCTSDGRFATSQPVFFGTNVFTASSVNVSGKETPISVGVGVVGASGALADAVTFLSGAGTIMYSPKQEVTIPIILEGGAVPYKVVADWGDGKKDESETKETTTTLKHTYQSKGQQVVKISIQGNQSKVQNYNFVAVDIKNQKPSKSTAVASTGLGTGSGPSVKGFVTGFSFGLYALALVVVLPFVRSSRYAPEIIEDDNNRLFED